MRMFFRSVMLASVLLMAAGAQAQEVEQARGPQKPISVGLLLGYGIAFDDPNGWGFGLGVRGGYNLGKIFLGARFVYHFGETAEAESSGLSLLEATMNLWDVGVEGGYDLLVADRLTIRPEVGLGIATRMVSSEGELFGDSLSGSETDPYLALGASGLYDITPDVFLGLDGRFQFILGDGSPSAFVLLVNVGMRF